MFCQKLFLVIVVPKYVINLLCVPPSNYLVHPICSLIHLTLMANILVTCHVNAQSLTPHFDEFLDYFTHNFYHVITISETWLKPTIPSSLVSLPNYTFLRHDRMDRTGGGVGLFVHDSLKSKILLSSPHSVSSHIEYMFAEITTNSSPILFGVIYRPPRVPFDDTFETALLNLIPSYSKIILSGDFNTNLLTPSPDRNYLTNLIHSLNLYAVSFNPTHHTQFSDSWLDLYIIDSPNNLLSSS